MKISLPRYSMSNFLSDFILKLDIDSCLFVSDFVKYFNNILNLPFVDTSSPIYCYFYFFSTSVDYSAITQYVISSSLSDNTLPDFIVNSVESFVYFVENFCSFRKKIHSDMIICFDIDAIIKDILSKQF